jgi:outer membrane protein assembly factor BamE (lipoprotein component of BamABCDE complex)
MKFIGAIIIATILTGCASSVVGVKVDETKLAAFKPGETTKEQVIAALGFPTTQVHSADGTWLLMYSYAKSHVRPETFIPFVGLFAGGVDSSGNSVMLKFDADGKLMSTTSSTTTIRTGRNPSTETVEPVTQGQPTQ